jgi:multidrug efflux pump subunit AcrB
MGVLLTFMFLCNMLVALVLVPALACYLLHPAKPIAQPATSLKEICV